MRDLPTDADDRKRETAELKGIAGELRGYVEHAGAASRWHAGRILNRRFGGSTQHGYGGERVARVARYLHVTESTLIVARWLHRMWKNADLKVADRVGLPYLLALSVLRLDAYAWRIDKDVRRGAGAPIRQLRVGLVVGFPGADALDERMQAWRKSLDDEVAKLAPPLVTAGADDLEDTIIAYLQSQPSEGTQLLVPNAPALAEKLKGNLQIVRIHLATATKGLDLPSLKWRDGAERKREELRTEIAAVGDRIAKVFELAIGSLKSSHLPAVVNRPSASEGKRSGRRPGRPDMPMTFVHLDAVIRNLLAPDIEWPASALCEVSSVVDEITRLRSKVAGLLQLGV